MKNAAIAFFIYFVIAMLCPLWVVGTLIAIDVVILMASAMANKGYINSSCTRIYKDQLQLA